MELQSNGYNFTQFDSFRPDGFRAFHIQQEQFQFDKKYQACYRLWRYKNNRKHLTDSNNESMHIIFDSNLSADFSRTHINLATHQSLSIYLIEVHQKDWGKTQLVFRIEYVDSEQNLFQNKEYDHIDTLPGSVARRMKFYKQEFDRISQDIINRYQDNGFSINHRHIIDNLASYLYFNHLKQPAHYNLDYCQPINQVLAIFSVLNGDCLTDRATLNEYNSFVHWERINTYQPVTIAPEQQDCLDRIIGYRKSDYRGFEQLIAQSMVETWSGKEIQMGKLKELVAQSPLADAGML